MREDKSFLMQNLFNQSFRDLTNSASFQDAEIPHKREDLVTHRGHSLHHL